MVKEGPCYHCGTETTPLWRNGPPAKPVLCNACGSRWRTRGSLKDYVPKHAMRETQNSQTGELPATESFDQSASNSPNEENAAGSSEPNFDNIPKRRRSNLDQLVLSPMERLNKQLYNIAQEQQDVYMNRPVVEDILIDQANNMMSTTPETLLGAMLLGPNEPEPTESVSSTNARTSASASTENGSDQGESSAT